MRRVPKVLIFIIKPSPPAGSPLSRRRWMEENGDGPEKGYSRHRTADAGQVPVPSLFRAVPGTSSGPVPGASSRRLATILWHMLKRKQKYRYDVPIQKHREFEAFEGQTEAA
jgi:hypothetical protein